MVVGQVVVRLGEVHDDGSLRLDHHAAPRGTGRTGGRGLAEDAGGAPPEGFRHGPAGTREEDLVDVAGLKHCLI